MIDEYVRLVKSLLSLHQRKERIEMPGMMFGFARLAFIILLVHTMASPVVCVIQKIRFLTVTKRKRRFDIYGIIKEF